MIRFTVIVLVLHLIFIVDAQNSDAQSFGGRRPTPSSSERSRKRSSSRPFSTAPSSLPESSSSDPFVPSYPDFVTKEVLDEYDAFCKKFNLSSEIAPQLNHVKSNNAQNKVVNFAKTYDYIKNHNKKYKKGDTSFKCELNSRATLSLEERRRYMNGLMSTVEAKMVPEPQPSFPQAPISLDYRNLGYVTEVVDQGFFCSSCYAYSAQASIEGAVFKKYGRLIKLSDQSIIDCNKNDATGNWGCNGGIMSAVYEYIIGNNGTEAASTYPLGDVQYPCKFNSTRTSTFLKSYGFINGDEEVLKRALNSIGPLAIGINGGIDSFFFYGSGVYDDNNCNDSNNHAVALIGYGTDNSFSPPKDYWIIKNSWGTYWGENGFMRIVRGKNMCGLKKYVLYPVIK